MDLPTRPSPVDRPALADSNHVHTAPGKADDLGTARSPDGSRARVHHWRILPVIRLFDGHRYVSTTKVALGMIEFDMGKPRLPRVELFASMNTVPASLEACSVA